MRQIRLGVPFIRRQLADFVVIATHFKAIYNYNHEINADYSLYQ